MRLSPRQRFAAATLANFGVWTFVALVATDVLISDARRDGVEVDVGHVFAGQVVIWLPLTVITWLIFLVARRLNRAGATMARTLLAQLALWMGWTLAFSLYLTWPAPDPAAWLQAAFARRFSPWLWIDVLVYLAIVGVAYGSMFYRRYTDEARCAAELRERLTRAELAALRARLDPHFLFNSLNTVAALVRTRDDASALTAIARLSELLRAILASRDRIWTRLDEELAVAQSYLALQKLRFGDQLKVDVEVDDACRPARMPDMVLLPLVENAVRHGTLGGVDRRVALRAILDQQRVDVTLENHRGEGEADDAGFGIGLETTRARLDRLFGPEAKLDLEMTDGVVITRLTFPFTVEAATP